MAPFSDTVGAVALEDLDPQMCLHDRARPVTCFMLNAATGAAGGAAAAGGGMYLLCKSKCPGGTGIAAAGKNLMGGMNDFLFGKKSDDEEPELDAEAYDVQRIEKIHRRTCTANCKIDALLAAAGGAAAGGVAGHVGQQQGVLQTKPFAGPIDEWTASPFFAGLSLAGEFGEKQRCRGATARRRQHRQYLICEGADISVATTPSARSTLTATSAKPPLAAVAASQSPLAPSETLPPVQGTVVAAAAGAANVRRLEAPQGFQSSELDIGRAPLDAPAREACDRLFPE
eukprot:TRINITY_DN56009_c0_g1_i1.p1 TRINITY_DN56009_c0_g1~~TRINITY_DN56009_c0_g1_i1.p1  ORF type:complete len:286 (-),score=55.77 TRINITY_DN56009_c0_g1_i1:135-992(-)